MCIIGQKAFICRAVAEPHKGFSREKWQPPNENGLVLTHGLPLRFPGVFVGESATRVWLLPRSLAFCWLLDFPLRA